jgi:hypothetical protein
VRLLEVYDREGDAGLERELLRLHPDRPESPDSRFARMPLGPDFPNSYMLVLKNPPKP